MKNIRLLLGITLILSSSIYAQVWERSLPIYKSGRANCVINTPDSGWITGNHSNFDDGGYAFFQRFDKNGNLVNKINSVQGGFITSICADKKGDFYACGPTWYECDVTGNGRAFIAKYNDSLRQLWYSTFNGTPTYTNQVGLQLEAVISSSNELKLLNSDALITIDIKNGKMLHSEAIDSNSLSLALCSDGAAIISTNKGVVKIDSSGKMMWRKAALTFSKIKPVSDNLFVATNQKDLFLMDSSGSIIKIFSYTSNFSSITEILNLDSGIYLIARDLNDSADIAAKFDYSLKKIWQTRITGNSYLNSLATDGKHIVAAGSEASENDTRCLIKNIDTSGKTYTSGYDAGVIGIIPGKLSSIVISQYETHYFVDLDVLVKNYGKTTIDSISVFTDGSFDNGCNFFTDPLKKYNSLKLASGDSVTLHLGNFEFDYGYTNKQICAYTCSPNGVMDMNYQNDKACMIYTGIQNQEVKEMNFTLFPNPAHDNLEVSFEKPVSATFEIINSLGQVVSSSVFSKTGTQKVDVSLLRPGMYFINIHNNEMSRRLKFIKE